MPRCPPPPPAKILPDPSFPAKEGRRDAKSADGIFKTVGVVETRCARPARSELQTRLRCPRGAETLSSSQQGCGRPCRRSALVPLSTSPASLGILAGTGVPRAGRWRGCFDALPYLEVRVFFGGWGGAARAGSACSASRDPTGFFRERNG